VKSKALPPTMMQCCPLLEMQNDIMLPKYKYFYTYPTTELTMYFFQLFIQTAKIQLVKMDFMKMSSGMVGVYQYFQVLTAVTTCEM
jgi:hypothetical protein